MEGGSHVKTPEGKTAEERRFKLDFTPSKPTVERNISNGEEAAMALEGPRLIGSGGGSGACGSREPSRDEGIVPARQARAGEVQGAIPYLSKIGTLASYGMYCKN